MANGAYLRQVHRIFDGGTVAGLSEGQLLERFVSRRDETAFEALVARHGPMVFGVCRRILRDPSDAEDAFQATFLVLVRQARSIRGRDSLGGWLHRVAYRVAVRASTTRRKPDCVELDSLAAPAGVDRDLIALIHEELDRLPSKYRDPIILCDLENHTHEEAARTLHWPLGTVKGRLSRARNLLKERLTRRGIGAPAVAVGVALGRDAKAIVSPALLDSTVRAAMSVAAAKGLAAGAASAVAVGLAQGVLQTMFWNSMKLGVAAIVAVGLIGVAGVGTFGQGPGGDGKGSSTGVSEAKQVDPPQPPAPPEPPDAAAPGASPITDPNADLRPTARAILGTWKVIDRIDGNVDEIGLPFKDKVVITRDRIQLGKPGEADLSYKLFLLNQPKQIVMDPLPPLQPRNSIVAVFRLDGDRLTMAYSGLDHVGVTPGSVDNIQAGGDIFVVTLERVVEEIRDTTKPPVASPDADITKLQGTWVLKDQTSRLGGKEYHVKAGEQGMFGAIGGGFFIEGYDIRDNQSLNNAAPTLAKIAGYDGGTDPKQIDIRDFVSESPPNQGVPVLKDITLVNKLFKVGSHPGGAPGDLLPSRGIPVGKAIYKLEENRFTICYDPVHPDVRPQQFPRPTDDIGNDTRVESVFERVVPANPLDELKETTDVRGRWKVLSIVDNGTLQKGRKSREVIFDETMMGRTGEDGIEYTRDYRVDRNAQPLRIDFLRNETPENVEVQHGIYKIVGDRLTLCMSEPGSGSIPTEFASRGGFNDQLITLERIGSITKDQALKLEQARAELRGKQQKPVTTAPPAPGNPPKPATEAASTHDLRGRWKLIGLARDGVGRPVPREMPIQVYTGTIMGSVNGNGVAGYGSDYTVNINTIPMQIDLSRPQVGTKPPVITRGIYRIVGDELTVCTATEGGERPTEFESTPGLSRVLAVLRWEGPLTEELELKILQARAKRLELLSDPVKANAPAPPPEAPPAPGVPLPPPRPEPLSKADLRGRWKLVSIVRSGQPLPVFEKEKGKVFIYTKSLFGSVGDDGVEYGSDYVIASDTNHITFLYPQTGKLHHGLFRLEGDDLTLCLPDPEQDRRPTDFVSTPGSDISLFTYKRVGPLTEELIAQIYHARAESLRRPDQTAKASTVPPAPSTPAETHANGDIRGCWKLISKLEGGQEVGLVAWTAVYTDNWYGEIKENGLEFKVPYRVETDVEPRQLKYLRETNGEVQFAGIYKIEGDRLTVCLAPPNRDEVVSLPSEFETKAGSRYQLLTFRWAGPITKELEEQIQRSHDEQTKRREEQRRKLSDAASKLTSLPAVEQPVNAPVRSRRDIDDQRAELEMERDILSKELSTIKEGVFNTTQQVKSTELYLKTPNSPAPNGLRLTDEARKKLALELPRLKEELNTQKKFYVEKFKELSRLKKEMAAFDSSNEPKSVDPSENTRGADGTAGPAERLADFDRQIRLLQQKRDAYLMSLPDEERQTLLKQITP